MSSPSNDLGTLETRTAEMEATLTNSAKISAACGRLPFLALAMAVLAFVSMTPGGAFAQMGPDYWQVTGVPPGDHLNIRLGPSAQNRIVAHAPNGAVFRNLGCRGNGNGRWCHLETPNGDVNGWASGRYLMESGAPRYGNISGRDDVPELHLRNTGEMEVRFASGCTTLYNPAGRRIATGSSCSRTQLSRAHDAVERYMREQGGPVSAEGGASGNANVSGIGSIIGGGTLTASIIGHREGHYALVMTGDGMTCSGVIKHAPGPVGSETSSIHCTNGSHGTAVLGKSGKLLTFNLFDGTGGFATFR
jgi:hypothetical protein